MIGHGGKVHRDGPPDARTKSGTEEDSVSTSKVTAALIIAVIAFAVQQTSVVPAIHDVQQALGASQEWASWLVTVYLMVATVATPAMGRLADLYGRRRMLLIGLAVFAAASVGAAAAPDLATLIVFRAVQGIGGAVYPLALALARDAVPERQAGRLISLLTAAFGIGTAFGFVGGGWLAQDVSWRAIFLVGAVLVALALLLTRWAVPDLGDRAGGGYDIAGTVLLAAAALSLLAGLTLVVSLGWLSPITLALLAVALASAAWWLRHEQHTDDPLIDIHVLRQRSVAVTNIATVGLGWAMFGSYLLIPQFARTTSSSGYGLGADTVKVGLLLLPLAVGQTLAAPLAGSLTRVPARRRFAGGLALVAVANLVLALTRHGVIEICLAALLLGAGAGISLQASSATATEDVDQDVAAVSAAVNSTVRRLAGGIGGQVATILLASLLAGSTAQPSFSAYVAAYLIATGMCALGAALLVLAGNTARTDTSPADADVPRST